jgi:hypothetical protein
MFSKTARSLRGIRATLHESFAADPVHADCGGMCVSCIGCEYPLSHTYPGDLCRDCQDEEAREGECRFCGGGPRYGCDCTGATASRWEWTD